MLGFAVVAILTLSVGAAFAIAAPQYQRGGPFTGTTGGHGGGMMGAFGNMMSGYTSMIGSAGSAMGRYGGMMSQMFQQMTGSGNQTPSGLEGGRFLGISDYAFYPSNITVPKGTTVTWVNMDFVQHTVTSGSEKAPTGLFDSNTLGHMQTFSYTFNTAGIYSYYCDLHPNMVGTVRVTG